MVHAWGGQGLPPREGPAGPLTRGITGTQRMEAHTGTEMGPPDWGKEARGQLDPSFLSWTKQGCGSSRLLTGPSMALWGTWGVCLYRLAGSCLSAEPTCHPG